MVDGDSLRYLRAGSSQSGSKKGLGSSEEAAHSDHPARSVLVSSFGATIRALEAWTSAGVGGRHFPLRWRQTYATSLVRRGEDIHVVQRLMGHSNIATTSRYLHLSDADLIEAIDRAFSES